MNINATRFKINQVITGGSIITLSLFIAAASYIMLTRFGMMVFLVALGGLIGVFILYKISTKDLSFALILWLLSMAGFETITRVSMPGLPDISVDRLILIWIVLMFLIRLMMKQEKLRGPYTVDILMILHTAYILGNIVFSKPGAFPAWVVSNLLPLFAFIYGKYVINKENHLRNIFIFFFGLTIYYGMTAIAEHFHINFLVWPKTIINPNVGDLWQPGRSRGPVLHPPLFGQLQAMLMLVYFFFLIRVKSKMRLIMVCFGFAISLLGLLFAYTRGPWVAAGVAILVLAILRPNYRKIIGVMAVLSLLIGMLGMFQLANSDFLQERLNTTGTFEGRLRFIANSLRIIADHPLFGVGYYTAKDKMVEYSEGTYIPFYGYVKKKQGKDIVPHDIYVGRTADEGLVSAGLLFAISIIIFRTFVRKWRANPQGKWFNRDYMAVMAAIMACYLVGGMAIDYRYFHNVNVIMFLMMGIVYGFEVEPNQAVTTRR